MTSEATARPGMHPSIALSVYVEPLVRGRRVAILGDATIGLADELSQRGARLVHVYDPDAARTAEALARAAPGRPHQVSYAVLAADLGVRDGAFDLVVVPDLSLFHDQAEVVRRARRLCAQTGAAVFVMPNREARAARRLLPGFSVPPRDASSSSPPPALGYYELYDIVSLQFAKVRMIGQAPFVGYTVADFAPRGEPAVTVDTSLLAATEEPEHFIALASSRPLALDAYSVIELPWAEVSDVLVPSEPSVSARTGERLALAEAEARLTLLSAELENLREQAAAQAREVEARGPATAARAARLAELEGLLAVRDAKLKETEVRAGDNHVRAERLNNQIRDLEEELRRQRDRATKLSKTLDDEKKARTKAELELGMLRGRPEAPDSKERLDAMAAELVAARARIGALERDLSEAQRPPPSSPPDPKLLQRIGELERAEGAARREATDAAAQRDAAVERAARAEAKLASTKAELTALEQAKAELDARARAAAAEVGDLGRRLTEEHARLNGAEARAQAGARRLVEAEARTAELSSQLAELERLRAALAAELDDERRKRVDVREDPSASGDLTTLEAALQDRGRVIAALTRDLRESERVGKELLAELEELQASRGSSALQPPEDLRARMDALALSAARSEADMQAASWRIAQLERELAEARRGNDEPTRVQLELEQALAASRDEVALLRKAAGAP